MKRSHRYALLTILISSFVIRSIPFFRYTFWGIDYGEYVYYTNQWISRGSVYLGIDGWAQAYPFFPGMFVLGGSTHLIGVPLFTALQLPTLIVSTIVPIVIFLMTHRLTEDTRAALLSAIFLTVLAPFVYNYSQPKPETLGFFLMILILLLYMMLTNGKAKLLLLMILMSFALIVTHHFSSYFLILFMLGGLFFSVGLRRDIRKVDLSRIAFFLFFTTSTFIYWFFFAHPFRENRLLNALGMPSYTILFVPYIGLLGIFIIRHIMARMRIRPSVNIHNEDSTFFYVCASVLISFIIIFIIYLYRYPIPGRDIELGPMVFYYIPLSVLGIFVIWASKMIWAYKDGVHVLGWLSFVLISFIVGVITGSSSLLPMRQVAFVMMPTAVLFGIGFVRFYSLSNPFGDRRKYFVIFVILGLLLAWNLPLTYPSQDMTQGYIEGTDLDEVEGSYWIRGNLNSKVAAEHRLSAAAFAVGYVNLTWTDGYDIYFSDDYDRALSEAHEMDVRYIMWDHKTIKGVTTTAGAHPHPFNPTLLSSYRDNYLLYLGEETEVYIVP